MIIISCSPGTENAEVRRPSPHQNSVTEILVKMAKGVMNSMMDTLGTHILKCSDQEERSGRQKPSSTSRTSRT